MRKLDAGIKFSKEYEGQYIPRFEELYNKGIDPWCWCPDTDDAVQAAIKAGVTLMTVNNPYSAMKILRNKI